MNLDWCSAISALKVFIPSCALAFGTAHAGDASDVVLAGSPAYSNAAKKPLDLKAPELQRVMSHRRLLAALATTAEDESLVEIVAAPALVPMSSDAEAPLGIIGSLQWSADHPTQAWRILLPSPGTP
jgi:hypothetical protein